MVALILLETDSVWRRREVVFLPYVVEGNLSPCAGVGKVLMSQRAEQLLVPWTRRPRRPTGSEKLRGVATAP
jgi:hypothetical protein